MGMGPGEIDSAERGKLGLGLVLNFFLWVRGEGGGGRCKKWGM